MEQSNSITRRKKWKHLTERERYKIEAFLATGMRPAEIAREIGCSKRTIERERKRGMTEQLLPATSRIAEKGDLQIQYVYLADAAQRNYEYKAANKGRNIKIGADHALVAHIEKRIGEEHWSPAAVIGEIEEKGLEFDEHICIKTLYNYIDRGLFLNISNKALVHKKNSHKKTHKRVRSVALNNRNGKSIEERPDGANNRTEFGHWETDLVIGKKGTKPAILTLVERLSRKSLYVKTKDKTQEQVLKAIKRVEKRVGGDFTQVFKTITADNGPEFLDGAGIKEAAKCDDVYYAHPFSSWERGSNENGNGILRRFLPKGSDFSKLTTKELQRIEDWVNNYPRKIFGYKTANDIWMEITC